MPVPNNVLIVDDDTCGAEPVKALLLANGCKRVVILPDVATVLERANGTPSDLVLLTLDEGNLPELVSGAREIRRRLAVPMVFIVEAAALVEFEKMGGATPSEYVLKPFSARDIVVAVDAAMRIQALELKLNQLEAKMLEAMRLESVGVLAGGIAHEFNNLLTGIFGAVTIAQQDLPARSPVLPRLDHIERAATRAADLSQQLQEQARQGTSARALLSLDALVEDAVKLARAGFKPGVTLQTGFAGNLPPVYGNEAQLRQIVANLVANAAESFGGVAGTIRVVTFLRQLDVAALGAMQFAEEAKPGEHVVVEIAAAGGGLEADAPRTMDPFASSKPAGRSLELAIWGRVVRKHHGGLGVEHVPGTGSAIRIFLPLLTEARTITGSNAPIAPGVPAVGGAVLVVDDDEAVRALAQWVVEKAGYRAVTASDGDEALRIYKAAPAQFSLVLLDLTMPRVSGPEVAAGMRLIRPGVPVIMITGHCEDVMVAEAQAGVVDFLQKPFGPEQLRALLARYLPKVANSAAVLAK